MRAIKLTLIISFFSILNANNDVNLFDEYHDGLCKVLVNTSNSIDDYFIDDNSSSLASKTHAKFSTSFAKETNIIQLWKISVTIYG